jgi:hypothetical protein
MDYLRVLDAGTLALTEYWPWLMYQATMVAAWMLLAAAYSFFGHGGRDK